MFASGCEWSLAWTALQVVLTAFTEAESLDVAEAQRSANLLIPTVGICLGEAGRLSRVLNRKFTPVRLDGLPAAAPGQVRMGGLGWWRGTRRGMDGALRTYL